METKLFLPSQSINNVHRNEYKMIVVLNHKKSGDYYKNPSLPYLTVELYSKENYGKESFYFQTKTSILCIPMREI